MPNLRSKTWTETTPAEVTDAQYWEDHLISDADYAKIGTAVQTINSNGPDASGNINLSTLPTGGTSGQILVTNTSGNAAWANAPVVDDTYDPTSYNAQDGRAVATAVSSKANTSDIDDWYKTASVSSGYVTFTGVDDTHNYAYKPYFVLTSTSSELNPTAKITSRTGAGTSSMSITYQTTADNGTDNCWLRRIKS